MPVFEGAGYLDSFGVFRGNTLASVMFWGTTEAPTIYTAEVPCVAQARFFMNYYSASKRPNRGSGVVKWSIEKFPCRLGWVKSLLS